MKAIMISIHPQWVAKILNGDLSILVRKKFPKDYVGWVYIYVTKDKKPLFECSNGKWYVKDKDFEYDMRFSYSAGFNGKIVARFWCGRVEEIKKFPLSLEDYNLYRTSTIDFDDFEKASCLSQQELDQYLEYKNGYAIHITKLEIFDNPKEISEFEHQVVYVNVYTDEKRYLREPLRKAPQSYMFIEI